MKFELLSHTHSSTVDLVVHYIILYAHCRLQLLTVFYKILRSFHFWNILHKLVYLKNGITFSRFLGFSLNISAVGKTTSLISFSMDGPPFTQVLSPVVFFSSFGWKLIKKNVFWLVKIRYLMYNSTF